jgi:hypothetical protein
MVFGTDTLGSRTRPSSMAVAVASTTTEVARGPSYSTMAFFGPRVGIAVSARTPTGAWARRSSTCLMVPVCW